MTPTDLAAYAQNWPSAIRRCRSVTLDEDAIRAGRHGRVRRGRAGLGGEARLIQLTTRTASAAAPMLGVHRQGVTFDSGGLWIKPGPSKIDMKFDMAGGAAVIEAVAALAELGLLSASAASSARPRTSSGKQ